MVIISSQLLKADLGADGYYRVRSVNSGSNYITLVNDQFNYNTIVSYAGGGTALVLNTNNARAKAIERAVQYMQQDVSLFSDNPVTNPGSVFYISNYSDKKYNLQSQHTGVHEITYGTWNSSMGNYDFHDIYLEITDITGTSNPKQYIAGAQIKKSIVNLGYLYFSDDGSAFNFEAINSTKNPAQKFRWYIEPYDTDFNTKDVYFSIDPNVMFQDLDGHYYATLRTSFNYKYQASKITGYVVTGINGDCVTVTKLNPASGKDYVVVPADEFVLLECNSNVTSENVLLPTTETASSVSGNILVSAVSTTRTPGGYFENLARGATTWMTLGTNATDAGFVSQAPAKVSGNRGYLVSTGNAKVYLHAKPSAPTITVPNTVFKDQQTVTITASVPAVGCSPEAKIYYTTDGSNPTLSSTLYTGAFTITETATIKAVVSNHGRLSDITELKVEKIEKPTISPSSTTAIQGDIITATIACSTDGAAIKYSLDGTNWSDYSGQLTFTQNCTLYAKAVKNGVESDIATATYTFTALSAPSITPASAEAVVGETITFTATNPNGGSSTMQYCIDGGAWTTTTGTISVTSTEAKTGTVEVKVVNGNAESPVATATYTFAEAYQDIKLANLVNMPVDDTKYNITDLTCINVIDNAGLLICKDNNGYASRDVTENGWIDYMQQVSGLNVPETYDQSNWIALRLPQGTAVTNDMIHAPLSGVKGHLVNANNLEFQLDAMPDFGSRVTFTPNTYIPASFKGTQESANGKTYFFVQPKPMEYAHIEWAVSRGDKFVTAPRDLEHGINTAGLSGEFEFNGMYLGDFGLEWDHVYMMDALIKRYTDNFDHVYVMGNVDGLVFDSRKGVEMYTADGKVYTATVTVSNAANNVNGFFGFTKELGATWESIAGYRYGANENNKYVTADTYDIDIVQGTNSFAILPGTYALTLNMETGKLTIATASANAPRRADAQSTARYIVYPVNLTETSNSIITGVMNVAGVREVAAVEYVNLAGQRSSRPWQGVNIVITRYTDGTVTTAKECK